MIRRMRIWLVAAIVAVIGALVSGSIGSVTQARTQTFQSETGAVSITCTYFSATDIAYSITLENRPGGAPTGNTTLTRVDGTTETDSFTGTSESYRGPYASVSVTATWPDGASGFASATCGQIIPATSTPTVTNTPAPTSTPAPTATTPAGNVEMSVELEYDCVAEYNSADATITIVVTGGSVTVDSLTATLEGSSGGTTTYVPADFVGRTLAPGTYTVEVRFRNFTTTAPTLTVVVNASFSGVSETARDSFALEECDDQATPTTGPTNTPTQVPSTPTQVPSTPTSGPSVTPTEERPTLTPTSGPSATPTTPPPDEEGDVSLEVRVVYECASEYNNATAIVTIFVSGEAFNVDAFTATLEGSSGGTTTYTPADIVGQRLEPGTYEVRVNFNGFTLSSTTLNAVINATFSGQTRTANATFSLEQCVTPTTPTDVPPSTPTDVPPSTPTDVPPGGGNPTATPTQPSTVVGGGGETDEERRRAVAGESGEAEAEAERPRTLLPATGTADTALLMLAAAILLIALGGTIRAYRLRRR